jgi:hypothetical protein
MADQDLAAIVAAVVAALKSGETPTSAPAAAPVASPFAASARVSVAGVAVDGRPAVLQGLSMQDTRKAAAIFAVPGYSCTVDADWSHGGETVHGAAHGFATPRKSGEPCATLDKAGCTGTIR